MSKQVRWTKKTYDDFCMLAMLNSDEQYILQSRIEGVPISEQAIHLHCSTSKVDRMISLMKKKYDTVQKLHPDTFPVRTTSAKETWLDTH